MSSSDAHSLGSQSCADSQAACLRVLNKPPATDARRRNLIAGSPPPPTARGTSIQSSSPLTTRPLSSSDGPTTPAAPAASPATKISAKPLNTHGSGHDGLSQRKKQRTEGAGQQLAHGRSRSMRTFRRNFALYALGSGSENEYGSRRPAKRRRAADDAVPRTSLQPGTVKARRRSPVARPRTRSRSNTGSPRRTGLKCEICGASVEDMRLHACKQCPGSHICDDCIHNAAGLHPGHSFSVLSASVRLEPHDTERTETHQAKRRPGNPSQHDVRTPSSPVDIDVDYSGSELGPDLADDPDAEEEHHRWGPARPSSDQEQPERWSELGVSVPEYQCFLCKQTVLDVPYECEDCERNFCPRCHPIHNKRCCLRLASLPVCHDSSEGGRSGDDGQQSDNGRGSGDENSQIVEDREPVFSFNTPVTVGHRIEAQQTREPPEEATSQWQSVLTVYIPHGKRIFNQVSRPLLTSGMF